MELKNIVTETRYYIDDEHGETLDDHLNEALCHQSTDRILITSRRSCCIRM